MEYRYAKHSRYVPGDRAQATGMQFQESLLALLELKPWRDIRAVDVARRVGLSPASLYQYYPHLDAVALETAAHLEQEGRPVPEHLAKVVALLRWEQESEGSAE